MPDSLIVSLFIPTFVDARRSFAIRSALFRALSFALLVTGASCGTTHAATWSASESCFVTLAWASAQGDGTLAASASTNHSVGTANLVAANQFGT